MQPEKKFKAGAISVTLDIWHKDVLDYMDMQTETGDIRSKSFDVFPAVGVPDIFMKRVQENGTWTLFDPKEIIEVTGITLQNLFGDKFEKFYIECENNPKLKMKIVGSAKDLFKKFLKTTVEECPKRNSLDRVTVTSEGAKGPWLPEPEHSTLCEQEEPC